MNTKELIANMLQFSIQQHEVKDNIIADLKAKLAQYEQVHEQKPEKPKKVNPVAN